MKQIGRLAMRQEGHMWNAYYALPDTMEGSVWLGSIAIRFIKDKSRKEIFLHLMREAVADIIEEATGERPTWPNPPEIAPERERTKS